MMEYDFKFEQNRIYLEDGEKLVAEITFPVENGVATIDHTFVDSSLAGQGIAGKLVAMAVEVIQKNGWHINASCSYASKWLEKNYLSAR